MVLFIVAVLVFCTLYYNGTIYFLMSKFFYIPFTKIEVGGKYDLLFQNFGYFVSRIKTNDNPFLDLREKYKKYIDSVKILDIKKGYVKYCIVSDSHESREMYMKVSEFKEHVYVYKELLKLTKGV